MSLISSITNFFYTTATDVPLGPLTEEIEELTLSSSPAMTPKASDVKDVKKDDNQVEHSSTSIFPLEPVNCGQEGVDLSIFESAKDLESDYDTCDRGLSTGLVPAKLRKPASSTSSPEANDYDNCGQNLLPPIMNITVSKPAPIHVSMPSPSTLAGHGTFDKVFQEIVDLKNDQFATVKHDIFALSPKNERLKDLLEENVASNVEGELFGPKVETSVTQPMS